jgi:Ankyrin repeats (3 copies)
MDAVQQLGTIQHARFLDTMNLYCFTRENDKFLGGLTRLGWNEEIQDHEWAMSRLCGAVSNGYVDVVTILVERMKSYIGNMAAATHLKVEPSDTDLSLLLCAAAMNNALSVIDTDFPEVVRILLKLGFDANQVTGKVNRSALHMAAMCGSHEVAAVLLENNKTLVNIQDSYGATALYLACMEKGRTQIEKNRIWEVVKVLFRNGADPRIEKFVKPDADHVAAENRPQILLDCDKYGQDWRVARLVKLVLVEIHEKTRVMKKCFADMNFSEPAVIDDVMKTAAEDIDIEPMIAQVEQLEEPP